MEPLANRMKPLRGVMVGNGNVASHLAPALERAGAVQWLQRWNRTEGEILPGADFYLISVADHAMAQVVDKLPAGATLYAHTSGSVPMEIFAGKGGNYGVFYPLQTFSKGVELNLAEVPFFIEGNNTCVTQRLEELAAALSPKVYRADSALRAKMHVAAVFACNFTNHLWALADGLLRREGLELGVLHPLLKETLRKAMEAEPAAAQTGPARRGDKNIMAKHESTLTGTEREIYALLSKSITQMYGK